MPDHLDSLFDDLRRRELPRVRPPGADAARRTVHRRATVRATAYAAVVMAAGGTFVLAQRGGTDDGVAPAAPPSSSAMAFVSGEPVPGSSAGLWRGLPNKAEIAAGLVPGANHTDVMADYTQEVGLEAEKGRHRLQVGCSGPAPLPITILLGGAVDQQDTIPCEDSGVVREYEVTLTTAGSVRVLLGNTGQFDAYALKLTKI